MLLVQEEYINSDKVVKIAKLPIVKKPIKLVGLPTKPIEKLLPLQLKPVANPLKLKPTTDNPQPVPTAGLQKFKLKKPNATAVTSAKPDVLTIQPQKISISPIKAVSQNKAHEELICTEKSKQPSRNEEVKITSLYGLDLDLLRSLNMGNLIEEKTKQMNQPMPERPVNANDHLSIDEMRKTFGQFPQKKSKLRIRDVVKEYANDGKNTDSD